MKEGLPGRRRGAVGKLLAAVPGCSLHHSSLLLTRKGSRRGHVCTPASTVLLASPAPAVGFESIGGNAWAEFCHSAFHMNKLPKSAGTGLPRSVCGPCLCGTALAIPAACGWHRRWSGRMHFRQQCGPWSGMFFWSSGLEGSCTASTKGWAEGALGQPPWGQGSGRSPGCQPHSLAVQGWEMAAASSGERSLSCPHVCVQGMLCSQPGRSWSCSCASCSARSSPGWTVLPGAAFSLPAGCPC